MNSLQQNRPLPLTPSPQKRREQGLFSQDGTEQLSGYIFILQDD